jgi:arginine-tRNA-protein transferase
MANPAEEDFKQFLFCNWCDTQFLELRLKDQLVAVAVTDMVSDGVSAVYSFFDPDLVNRGLGSYCILTQIAFVEKLGLDYVYLGYWIKNHKKMHYKTNFRPLQLYLDEQWQTQDSF